MHLTLTDKTLCIDLKWHEQLWAFMWNNPLAISLDHITQVSTTPPPTSWKDLRAPGTALPGVIRAGTYYTPRGKEFWYATKTGGYLTLDLEQSPYRRIILTISQNESWAEQIQAQVQRAFEAG